MAMSAVPTARRRARAAHATLAAVTLAALVSVGGCALIEAGTGPPPPRSIFDGSDRTPKEALTEFFAALDDIMELVEPTEIAEPIGARRSSITLSGCGQFHDYLVLSGGGGRLDARTDPVAIIDRIDDHFSDHDDWKVLRLADDAAPPLTVPPPKVHLHRNDGITVYVSVEDSGTRLQLSGFTGCFTHPRAAPGAGR
jgi:hypothetical protein